MFNSQKIVCRIIIIIFFLTTAICPSIYAQRFAAPPVLRECWFYPNDQIEEASSASDNNSNLYIPLSDGKLIAINSDTLEKYWETELAGVFTANVLVSKDSIYVLVQILGGESGKLGDDSPSAVLYSLNKATGITQWQSKISSSDKTYLCDVDDSVVVIDGNGNVYSIAKVNGTIIWEKSLGNKVSSLPFISKDTVTVGSVNRQVFTLALRSGQLTEKFETTAPPTVIVEDTTGNNFVVGDKRGFLQSLNKKRKTRNWAYRQGAETSFVKATKQGLLVSSLDNFLCLISESSGKLLWKKRLTGRITVEPQVRDNYFTVASIDDPGALLVELSSGKVISKITLEAENFFIGATLQSKNLFIYTTRKGLFAFSVGGDDCHYQKNRL